MRTVPSYHGRQVLRQLYAATDAAEQVSETGPDARSLPGSPPHWPKIAPPIAPTVVKSQEAMTASVSVARNSL